MVRRRLIAIVFASVAGTFYTLADGGHSSVVAAVCDKVTAVNVDSRRRASLDKVREVLAKHIRTISENAYDGRIPEITPFIETLTRRISAHSPNVVVIHGSTFPGDSRHKDLGKLIARLDQLSRPPDLFIVYSSLALNASSLSLPPDAAGLERKIKFIVVAVRPRFESDESGNRELREFIAPVLDSRGCH